MNSEFLSDENVRKVYHYTSPAGLFSILNNDSIRFSDIQFLNDKSEYIYIKEPLGNVFNRISNKLLNFRLIETIDLWLQNDFEFNDSYNKYRYYILCTSLKEDDLNMWNYYVKTGKYEGYNLCIDVENFIKYIENEILSKDSRIEFWNGPVIYIKDKQESIIEKHLIEKDKELFELKKEVSTSDYIYTYFQNTQEEIIKCVEMCRLFFKNENFKDEKEYRFVLKIPDDIHLNKILNYGFRINNGFFCPYYELKIKKEIIKSITLSPMLDSDLAKKGLSIYIQNQNCEKIKILQSKIPIRY